MVKGKPNAPIIWDGVNIETVSISIHLLALCAKRVFHSTNLITKNINQRSCMCTQIFFQTGDSGDKTQALVFTQDTRTNLAINVLRRQKILRHLLYPFQTIAISSRLGFQPWYETTFRQKHIFWAQRRGHFYNLFHLMLLNLPQKHHRTQNESCRYYSNLEHTESPYSNRQLYRLESSMIKSVELEITKRVQTFHNLIVLSLVERINCKLSWVIHHLTLLIFSSISTFFR